MVQWIKVHAIKCNSLSLILRAQEKKEKKKHTIECVEQLTLHGLEASISGTSPLVSLTDPEYQSLSLNKSLNTAQLLESYALK